MIRKIQKAFQNPDVRLLDCSHNTEPHSYMGRKIHGQRLKQVIYVFSTLARAHAVSWSQLHAFPIPSSLNTVRVFK